MHSTGHDALGFRSSVDEPSMPRMLADIFPLASFQWWVMSIGRKRVKSLEDRFVGVPLFPVDTLPLQEKGFIRKTEKAETEYLGSDILCLE